MRAGIGCALLAIWSFFCPALPAWAGLDVSAGLEYAPKADLRYDGNSWSDYQIVDNITWLGQVDYVIGQGFQVGMSFGYYDKKGVDDVTPTHLSLRMLSLRGEYGYELTESGRTLLVSSMGIGYASLVDKNDIQSRKTTSTYIEALAGVRRFLTRNLHFEVDFRIKYMQFHFQSAPRKSYDYSGTGLKLLVGYRFGHPRNSGDKR